jgi:hypothetical protein
MLDRGSPERGKPVRTYDDGEVRAIFAAAARAEAERAVAAPKDTLTLPELQEIGREVGLDPERVALAAAALDRHEIAVAPQKMLGLPIEVGRTIALPRAPTDAEWEQMVALFRTTFRARGRVSSQAGFREWVNGNLHAYVERDETGYRLRLGTLKGDARPLTAVGAAGVLTGAAAFGSLLLGGGGMETLMAPWLISAAGIAALTTNFLRLPTWARQRRDQMERLAQRIPAMLQPGVAPTSLPPADTGPV